MTTRAQQPVETKAFTAPDFAANFAAQMAGFTSKVAMKGDRHVFIALTEGEKLAGFVKLEKPVSAPNFYINYLEVHPEKQQRGYSKILLGAVFELAAAEKQDVLVSSFTVMGRQRLQREVNRLKSRYPNICVAHEQY